MSCDTASGRARVVLATVGAMFGASCAKAPVDTTEPPPPRPTYDGRYEAEQWANVDPAKPNAVHLVAFALALVERFLL